MPPSMMGRRARRYRAAIGTRPEIDTSRCATYLRDSWAQS
jgi:hypothetical protein